MLYQQGQYPEAAEVAEEALRAVEKTCEADVPGTLHHTFPSENTL